MRVAYGAGARGALTLSVTDLYGTERACFLQNPGGAGGGRGGGASGRPGAAASRLCSEPPRRSWCGAPEAARTCGGSGAGPSSGPSVPGTKTQRHWLRATRLGRAATAASVKGRRAAEGGTRAGRRRGGLGVPAVVSNHRVASRPAFGRLACGPALSTQRQSVPQRAKASEFMKSQRHPTAPPTTTRHLAKLNFPLEVNKKNK